MSRAPKLGRADRLILGLAAACLLAASPVVADPHSCADPTTVKAVLRLLSEKLGLAGTLTLDHIRKAPTETAVESPVCEADVAGIRNGPTMFGRSLDRVRYRDGLPSTAAAAPSVDAQLTSRGAEVPPAPALLEVAEPAR